jgi:type I restriction enzyme S subunit
MNQSQQKISNIPKLRFTEFDEEWRILELDKLLIPCLREVEKPNNLYTSIGIRSHFKGTFQRKNSDPQKTAMTKLYKVEENDFILSITFAWEGALAMVKKEDTGGLVSHRFPTYTVNNSVLSISCFQYIFPRTKMKYILSNLSPGGAGRNRVLNKKDFLKIKINLPSLLEQQKIASFLESVDYWISNLKSQKESLEKYKKGIMQKIFAQEIRFKDENGKDFPDWKEKKLGEYITKGHIIIGRGEVISKNDLKNFPGNNPIYSSSVKNEGLFGTYSKYMFNEELITWSVDGGGNFFYRKKHKFSITNVSGYIRINQNYFDYKFLSYCLQYQHSRKSFNYSNKAHPSVIKEIYIIKRPILREQQKIASFLSSLDDQIQLKTQQIEKAEQWKKGLMQGLFV